MLYILMMGTLQIVFTLSKSVKKTAAKQCTICLFPPASVAFNIMLFSDYKVGLMYEITHLLRTFWTKFKILLVISPSIQIPFALLGGKGS